MTIKKQAPLQVAQPGPLMLALRQRSKRNFVWRFFMDADQQWRWQHLTVEGEVVAEACTGYPEYDDCLADAKANGHVFEAAQPRANSGARYYFYAR
jgi:hypothetical protein